MKVVIISRAIFPMVAPRSMRATELAKEFAREGHDVILYGVLGEFDYSSFEKENNLRVKDLGPTRFAKLNSDGQDKNSLINKVSSLFLHRLLEYPDVELVFRVNKVLKKERDIDLLITIAHPYPIHWGAAWNKNRNNNFPTTWIADCGDPYMGNPFYKPLFYFKYIEKWFCKKVDYLTVPLEEAKDAYYPEFQSKIRVIPQGFKFEIPKNIEEPDNEVLTFIYAGIFYENNRDPRPFLDYLKRQLIDFRFIVYTKSVNLIKDYQKDLGDKLVIRDYIPREDLLEKMREADFLINIENINTVQSPSKLIDYAISGRPILSINTRNMNYDNINAFLKRNYSGSFKLKNLNQYHISNVVEKFIELCIES